jgi:uncharacterized GH25 family protein
MMRKSWMVFILVLAASLAWPLGSQAHMFWLTTSPETAAVSRPLKVEIGFGHKFPRDEKFKEGRLEAVKCLEPEGQEVKLKKISPDTYELVPPAPGVYVISAQMRPGFVCRTAKGMKLGTKKEFPDANLCFRFDMTAKTLVAVGPTGQGFDHRAGSSLEIMPLKDPGALKVGETLPLKVIFQGKPLAGTEVRFTHDNWPTPEKPFGSLGKTNAQGEIAVKLDKPGLWFLTASHQTPYAQPEECDENMFRASLTWRVKP